MLQKVRWYEEMHNGVFTDHIFIIVTEILDDLFKSINILFFAPTKVEYEFKESSAFWLCHVSIFLIWNWIHNNLDSLNSSQNTLF